MTQPRYQRFISHRLRNESEVLAFVSRQLAVQGDTRRHVFHWPPRKNIRAKWWAMAF